MGRLAYAPLKITLLWSGALYRSRVVFVYLVSFLTVVFFDVQAFYESILAD